MVFRDAIEPVTRSLVCRGLLSEYGIIWGLATGKGWRKFSNILFVEQIYLRRISRRFGSTYHLILQVGILSEARNRCKGSCKVNSYWFLVWLILRSWRMRRHIPPKLRWIFNWLVHSHRCENVRTYTVFSVVAVELPLGDLDKCQTNPRYVLKGKDWRLWIGFMWLSIGIKGENMCSRFL
jgi:hypothetical protein